MTHRQGRPYDGTIFDFVRDPVGSLASMPAFYGAWVAQEVCDVLLVRYEDMKAGTEVQLRRVIEFCGLAVDEPTIRRAVDAPLSNDCKGPSGRGSSAVGRCPRRRPRIPRRTRSVAQGGGYTDYLSPDEAFVDAAIAASAGARVLG